MIKKKALLTVAAAAAVLMANPTLNKAEAASYTPEVQQKVYVYQGSNMNEINSIIEKYLASFGITMPKAAEKQPIPTQPTQPTQPAPTQQPAQTPTPQQQQPVKAPQPTTPQADSTLSAYE